MSYIRNSIMPFYIQAAEAKTNAMVADIIKNSVNDELDIDNKSLELVLITKNSDNSIASIEMNTHRLNSLSMKLSSNIQSKLSMLNKSKVGIPMGVVFRNAMLSGIGPNINVTAASSGKTSIEYKSDFVSAGINQTIYRLYMEVHVEIFFTLPFMDRNTEIVTDILLAEIIIVGKVPAYYPTGKASN